MKFLKTGREGSVGCLTSTPCPAGMLRILQTDCLNQVLRGIHFLQCLFALESYMNATTHKSRAHLLPQRLLTSRTNL